jgi:transposase
MDHLAIDIGGRESQTCRRAPDGTIVQEERLQTRSLPNLFRSLKPTRVVMETCAESLWLADAAKAAGHEVRVVPATLAPMLGVGARRTKTDLRDARALSEVSCRVDLPSVHVSSSASREIKAHLSMHEGLVQSRTMLINTVRGYLRTTGQRCRSGASHTFAARVREALGKTLPAYVARQLEVLEGLDAAIAASEKELSLQAKADATAKRLMTVPGVGPMTALCFVATLDRRERFADAHRVQAYLGLTPGEHSSSERQRRTGITKAGSRRMRWLLVQAAWAVLRSRSARTSPLAQWALQVHKRRGPGVAAVALARKLAGLLYAMWRDGTTYDAQKTASVSEVQAPPLTTA